MGLVIINFAFGQTIKFQSGISISKLDWGFTGFPSFFDEPIIGFSSSVGVDYFDMKHYNLSSNLGIIRKGGKNTLNLESPDPVFPNGELTATLDYLTFNTTIDYKIPIGEKIIPYLSCGPRVDYLFSYNNEFNEMQKMDELIKISYGLLFGIGIKYKISKFQVGIKSDYCINFNKIEDWPATGENLGEQIKDKTLLLNLTIAYALR